jgi:hypothetical protein
VVVLVVAVAALLMVATGCSDPSPAGLDAGTPRVAATRVEATAASGTDAVTDVVAPTPFAVQGDRFSDSDAGAEASTAAGAVTVAEPSVGSVVDRLGYALVPQSLPTGFVLNIAEVLVFPSDITARQVYVPLGDGTASSGALELHITYPMRFTPDGDSFFEEAGFQVPDDVMEAISLGAMEAYLIRGGWDPDSMRIMQPYLAVWDYERSMTVMFLLPDTPSGPVWVAVRAELSTRWITVPELIGVAESLIAVE